MCSPTGGYVMGKRFAFLMAVALLCACKSTKEMPADGGPSDKAAGDPNVLDVNLTPDAGAGRRRQGRRGRGTRVHGSEVSRR